MPEVKSKSFRFASKPLPSINEINAELFWSLVDIKTPEECWDWKGTYAGTGYGYFNVNYRPLVATRISFYLTYNTDPLLLVVRHKCDRPSCVNPLHLELGTQKQNMQDAVLRGRFNQGDKNGSRTKPHRRPHGESHGQAKLTTALVVRARERSAAGDSLSAIAVDLGVYPALISKIVRGEYWPDAGGPIQKGKSANVATTLTKEEAQIAIDLRAEGNTVQAISDLLQVTQGAIWPILYGHSWKELDRSRLKKREAKKQISKDKWPDIWKSRDRGETLKSIADRYGVGTTAIHYIDGKRKKADSGDGNA